MRSKTEITIDGPNGRFYIRLKKKPSTESGWESNTVQADIHGYGSATFIVTQKESTLIKGNVPLDILECLQSCVHRNYFPGRMKETIPVQ